MRTELFFGLSSPVGPVSDAQFQAFVTEEVATRFQSGYTILDGEGQWQGADGRLAQEPARVIVRIHEGDEADQAAIYDIITLYKQRFRQESVLRTDESVCLQK